jgi:enterochelin esterase-like enzyme
MPTPSPLLKRLLAEGQPLMDGSTVTLLWRGRSAPCLIDDLHDWEESPQPLTKLAPGVWGISLKLPMDGYFEYDFYDPKAKQRLGDPLNPRRVWNGIGNYNHYVCMPGFTETPLARRDRSTPAGEVTRHQVPTRDLAVGAQRTLYLYRPPVPGPVPLLFVLDGMDYLRRGRLNLIVDNLIAQQRIRPIALAMVQHGGRYRSLEYSCGESLLGLLMECVLPYARQHLDLEPVSIGNYGLLGASLGGLSAVYSALRLPQVFRNVLSQSGAFIIPSFQFVVMELVRHLPRPDIHIYQDVGSMEWLLEGNRQMHALLLEKGYRVDYREYPGGHNYTSWRNDLWRGLESLYGEKLP